MTTKKNPAAKKAASKAKKAPQTKVKGQGSGEENVQKSPTSDSEKPKYPKYLDKPVTAFAVGTPDYADLVNEGNRLFKTVWNPYRVQPAVFYGIYAKLKEHYGVK